MKKRQCTIEEWVGAPQMDTGAPMPGLSISNDQLFVAYIVSESPAKSDAEQYAVVRFDGVLQHTFGYPNDEALGGHPIYPAGLAFYAFNQILGSPYLGELGARNAKTFPGTEAHFADLKHWIVTFHDETLEVVGDSVLFLGIVGARSAAEAVAKHAN